MIKRFLLLFLFPLCAEATELRPFASDGCSSFPDGTLMQQNLWLACCQAHDYAYWKGGTMEQRRQADYALEACVAAAGEPAIGWVMFNGVRVGGTPYLPTRFRWGYGWPFLRGYKALTTEELEQIKQLEAAE